MTPAVKMKKGQARLLTVAAYLFLGLGFIIPFAASGWSGMHLTDAPWAVITGLLLWVISVGLEWRVFVGTHADPSDSLWRRILSFIGRKASIWLLFGIAFGFAYHPSVSTTFFGTNFNAVLAITLAVMGIQITLDAWKQLVKDIRPVLLVVATRWVIMPLLGYCISFVAFYPFLEEEIAQQLAIGMILLATSPTGAASNSLTLISRGDLALSVSATTVSVLIAPFLQPFLIQLFAGSSTSVDAFGMFRDLATYVLAPVVIASIIGLIVPKLVQRIQPALQPIAVISLACVLMGTMSNGTGTILGNLGVIVFVLAACIIHGILGLSLGYLLPGLFGLKHRQQVAASYEVGVENAAIAPALAISYFGPLALLPAVVYGKTQNILAASVFAPYYIRKGEGLANEAHQAQGLSDIPQEKTETAAN